MLDEVFLIGSGWRVDPTYWPGSYVLSVAASGTAGSYTAEFNLGVMHKLVAPVV